MGTFPNKETQFTSENQPANRGRKKNIYNNLKKSELSKDDIINVFRLVLEQSPQQLRKDFEKFKKENNIQKSNKTIENKPLIYYNLISALFKDLKTGSLINLMSILGRWLGYPKQEIEHSGEIKSNLEDKERLRQEVMEILKEEMKKDV